MALLRVVAAQKERQVVPEATPLPTLLARAQVLSRTTTPSPGGLAEMGEVRALRRAKRHAPWPLGNLVLAAEVPEFVIMAAQKTALIPIPPRKIPVVLVALLAGALGEALGAAKHHVLLLGHGAERQTPTEQAVEVAPVLLRLIITALEAVAVVVATLETPALQVMPDPLQIQAPQTVERLLRGQVIQFL